MRSKLFSLLALLTLASFILAACGGTAPQTPAAPTAASGAAAPTAASGAAAPTTAPAAGALAVGIVLPTKDETRWTQDEARVSRDSAPNHPRSLPVTGGPNRA
ncbi:MAG: hypothetical protein M3R61_11065 [Chloroflexota bacterium]|nr:hypothetical protein [Chloroflexota bacterium]